MRVTAAAVLITLMAVGVTMTVVVVVVVVVRLATSLGVPHPLRLRQYRLADLRRGHLGLNRHVVVGDVGTRLGVGKGLVGR